MANNPNYQQPDPRTQEVPPTNPQNPDPNLPGYPADPGDPGQPFPGRPEIPGEPRGDDDVFLPETERPSVDEDSIIDNDPDDLERRYPNNPNGPELPDRPTADDPETNLGNPDEDTYGKEPL